MRGPQGRLIGLEKARWVCNVCDCRTFSDKVIDLYPTTYISSGTVKPVGNTKLSRAGLHFRHAQTSSFERSPIPVPRSAASTLRQFTEGLLDYVQRNDSCLICMYPRVHRVGP